MFALKRNADVRIFYMTNDKIFNRIPRGLQNYFSIRIGFRWADGILFSVTADDLKPFPNLQVLAFQAKKLFSLDANLFKYTRKSVWISLNDNILEHVEQDAFEDFGLKELHLNRNYCIDMQATTP